MKQWLFAPLMIALLSLAHCAPYPLPAGYAAAPAHAFNVYFAFGSVALTDHDVALLRDVAAQAAGRPGTPIRVIGHADAPGAPEGNAAISRRRTEIVAAELSRFGVPRERMSLEAFGESRPAVVTTPGAMQPENRRVEILIY